MNNIIGQLQLNDCVELTDVNGNTMKGIIQGTYYDPPNAIRPSGFFMYFPNERVYRTAHYEWVDKAIHDATIKSIRRIPSEQANFRVDLYSTEEI